MGMREVRSTPTLMRPRPAMRLAARRGNGPRAKGSLGVQRPWCEAVCLRCNAPIAIGEQIGSAEVPYILLIFAISAAGGRQRHIRADRVVACPLSDRRDQPTLQEQVASLRWAWR